MGKGKIAHYEQFLLFPQCFLLNRKIVSAFVHIFDIISLFAAELKEPKMGTSGEGFNLSVMTIFCHSDVLSIMQETVSHAVSQQYFVKSRGITDIFQKVCCTIDLLTEVLELCSVKRGLSESPVSHYTKQDESL